MHKQIISDEQFHCGVLPALSGVEHEDASFLTTWTGLHPRLGRVVACQGAGSDVALVTERAGEAVTVEAVAVAGPQIVVPWKKAQARLDRAAGRRWPDALVSARLATDAQRTLLRLAPDSVVITKGVGAQAKVVDKGTMAELVKRYGVLRPGEVLGERNAK